MSRIPDIFHVPQPAPDATVKSAVIPPAGKKEERLVATRESARVTQPIEPPPIRPPAVDQETRKVRVSEMMDAEAGPLVYQLQRLSYYIHRLGSAVHVLIGVLIGLGLGAWAWLMLYLFAR